MQEFDPNGFPRDEKERRFFIELMGKNFLHRGYRKETAPHQSQVPHSHGAAQERVVRRIDEVAERLMNCYPVYFRNDSTGTVQEKNQDLLCIINKDGIERLGIPYQTMSKLSNDCEIVRENVRSIEKTIKDRSVHKVEKRLKTIHYAMMRLVPRLDVLVKLKEYTEELNEECIANGPGALPRGITADPVSRTGTLYEARDKIKRRLNLLEPAKELKENAESFYRDIAGAFVKNNHSVQNVK